MCRLNKKRIEQVLFSLFSIILVSFAFVINNGLHTSTVSGSEESMLPDSSFFAMHVVAMVKPDQYIDDPKRFWKETSFLSSKYPDAFIVKGSSQKKMVALTFDDGPDQRFTPEILDILDQHDAKATFFVLGSKVKENPDILKRMYREGHKIGNHSWSHIRFDNSNIEKVKQEIEETEELIKDTIGISTEYIRPPYGLITEEQVCYYKNKGYKIIDWSVDSGDYISSNSKQVYQAVADSAHNGAIILMHSAGESRRIKNTVAALDRIIASLKEQGYLFTTIDKLLAKD